MEIPRFIPKHGGFRSLYSYQWARVVFKGTVYFVRRWVPRISRTTDQMVQAARSGKQNIVEGSLAAAMSKEMEIKLTGVAYASLGELLEDYRYYLDVERQMERLERDFVREGGLRERMRQARLEFRRQAEETGRRRERERTRDGRDG